jgi:Cys-tRNA(Pro)/Cys-tRNA(Cys) deacylase
VAAATPATQALQRAGVSFTLAAYDYDPDARKIGMQAAEALGEPPRRVLKTLVAQVDGKPVCVVLPSDREVSLKKLAQAVGGRAAEMAPPAVAERLTGYKIGGVSPFGQKRRLPTVLEAAALSEPYVLVNGGRRGLQIRLAPEDLSRTTAATVAAITAP